MFPWPSGVGTTVIKANTLLKLYVRDHVNFKVIDVLPSCLNERRPRLMSRMWGNTAIYSLIAVLHLSLISRKSNPMLEVQANKN